LFYVFMFKKEYLYTPNKLLKGGVPLLFHNNRSFKNRQHITNKQPVRIN
jgi:hypothetical protein